MNTIVCVDCGTDYQTKRKNTKRCRVCQTLQSAMYIKDRVKTCVVCEEKFAPLLSQDYICGGCDNSSHAMDAPGTCGFCGETTDRLIHESVKVCRKCSTDPDKRGLLIKALMRRQKELQGATLSTS